MKDEQQRKNDYILRKLIGLHVLLMRIRVDIERVESEIEELTEYQRTEMTTPPRPRVGTLRTIPSA